MSYLVFYFPAQQDDWPRRKGGYAPDELRFLRGRVVFDGNGMDVVVFPRYAGPKGRRVMNPIVFDERTTPPTLLKLPIGRESGSILVHHREHPMMPPFYIDRSGHIIRAHDGSIVIAGDEWNPPV